MESSVVEKPESGEAASSFTKSLLLGDIHEEMVFPWPQPDAEEQIKVRELCARARAIGESIDHRKVEEDRWIGDDVIRELGDAGLCGLYVDEKYGGQGLSQTGYARVFETVRPDRRDALDHPRRPPVDRLQGHRPVRHRRAEGALPPRPRRRPQARRLRADRARGRLRRLPPALARGPPARRLLGPERREALHRQRLEGRRLHGIRARRGRRRGPPHRTDPREGHGGLRGRRALRHDGAARQRPAAPLLQRRAGAAENVLGEPGDGFRIAMSILNNGRIGLGTGSVGAAKKLLDLTIHHTRERRQFGQVAGRLRARPGEDRLDGLLPVRARVDGVSDLRARRPGGRGLLAGVGDLQGLRDRVPLVRGQPRAAAARRRGLHERPSPTRRSCATSGSSRSSRAPTT